MREDIDWSRPIRAGSRAPLGSASQSRMGRFHGVRDEQIKRASILVKAAGGAPITKATVRKVVERLAAVVPGLRYLSGLMDSGA